MNEIIRKRKSIRRYDKNPLDESVLAKVRGQIGNLVPLYPDIKYTIEIAGKTKGLLAQGSGASSFLVFRSENKPGAYENIGFIGQQMDLYFSANGLGACWLGMAKPNEKTDEPYVISMAFGKPVEPLHRKLNEFKRKAISDISEGTDDRLEAARLAPSGMNAQGWFFSAANGAIHCYRKKPGLLPEKLGCIDIGIAIWHIASESAYFRFAKETNVPERKGYIYTGTVSR
jgi:nitroreductase